MQDYPWFQSYDPGVPRTLQPYPQITVLDILADGLKQRPEHPLCIFQGREVSYREIEEHSNALANALVAGGVEKGDRVICLFLNSPQSFVAFFAVWKAGGIVVPLNPLYTPFELERSIKDVEAGAAIIDSQYYHTVKSFQDRTKLRRLIVSDVDTYSRLPMKKEGGSVFLEKGDAWWTDLVEKYRGLSRPAIEVSPSDTALILFSGGTTGTPKGVMCAHHAIIITGSAHQAWYKSVTVQWEDRALVMLPLFHSFGVYVSFGSLLMGHIPQVLILNARDIKDMVESIRKYKVASMSATPTTFIAILNYPGLKPDDLRSLKRAGSGAAPLMAETKHEFEKYIGGPIIEGYGLTESGIVGGTFPVKGKWKQGAVGVPLPDVVVRIMDIETGTKELQTGETGEVVIKAPQLMQAFWKRPEETAQTLRDGWLYTGDIGYQDGDGYLFLTSRKKDLIKCGGFQVWPREIEEIIMTHPAVAEVCVAGIPDARQTEAVKAWVILKEGKQATPEELQIFCKEKLTGYKVPRFFEFRKELPKTLVGKVLRRVLQEEEKAK
ncbi:MAG: AMP-binding protein [Dehalococcoidia bacterium]|nr:AMP-binding protein [Dehalococcoidia bacterium]MDD5495400.1 AMP-binding protein [Dehalococcoidia bacterium]